jgi:hypothetical protein
MNTENTMPDTTLVIGSKATASFTSYTGQPQTLTMSGNWLDTTADIVNEAQGGSSYLPFSCIAPNPTLTPIFLGAVVARIDRKILSGKDLFFGQQTYGVQVAPGVDLALIAALCICLDEKNNDK